MNLFELLLFFRLLHCVPRIDLAVPLSLFSDLELLRSVWSAWQQEDAEALDMTVADSLEELGKHPLSPNRYLLLSSIYISKKLPEAFCLPRTLKVIPHSSAVRDVLEKPAVAHITRFRCPTSITRFSIG